MNKKSFAFEFNNKNKKKTFGANLRITITNKKVVVKE